MSMTEQLSQGRNLVMQPLTAAAFAPFGEVIDLRDEASAIINQGLCERHSDLIAFDVEEQGGKLGLSMFQSQRRTLPYRLEMVERHPLGSQAFIPMSHEPFLVVVAPDDAGKPGRPLAFLTEAGQGVNLFKGTWHGVLTPLEGFGRFAVLDRIGGEGSNLEEHWFDEPFMVVSGAPDA